MLKINNKESISRLEVALYVSGRPLSLEELIKASGTESKRKTMLLLDRIIQKTKSAFNAIEIAMLPDKSYVFQIKPEYSIIVRRYASKPTISGATLKTLSYIAYMQPISSKQLVETRGTGVYMHLKELRRLDYVKRDSAGRLKTYTTTEKFQKYFGLDGDIEYIKKKLFKNKRINQNI